MPWAAAAAPYLTAAGAGISAVSGVMSARADRRVADYNHQLQLRQAQQEQRMQLMQAQVARQQAGLQLAEAQITAAMQDAEARQRFANAERMRQATVANLDRARVNLARQHEKNTREKSGLRALIAGQGTTEAGSPMDAVYDLAEQAAVLMGDLRTEADLNYRQGMDEAAFERFAGQLAKAGAAAGLQIAHAEAGLRRRGAEIQQYSAAAGYRAARQQAGLTLMSARNAAQLKQASAFGGLFSGFASSART